MYYLHTCDLQTTSFYFDIIQIFSIYYYLKKVKKQLTKHYYYWYLIKCVCVYCVPTTPLIILHVKHNSLVCRFDQFIGSICGPFVCIVKFDLTCVRVCFSLSLSLSCSSKCVKSQSIGIEWAIARSRNQRVRARLFTKLFPLRPASKPEVQLRASAPLWLSDSLSNFYPPMPKSQLTRLSKVLCVCVCTRFPPQIYTHTHYLHIEYYYSLML